MSETHPLPPTRNKKTANIVFILWLISDSVLTANPARDTNICQMAFYYNGS